MKYVMSASMAVLALRVASAGQGLDHSTWDRLLKRFVTPEARVDYGAWKAAGTDELDSYLRQLASRWPASLSASERKAALINAYNALTIRWILSHYPVESIWKTEKPFASARHVVDGEKVSLDAIETRLRETADPRIHSALVCAARSCPPLRKEAWSPDRLEQQLDDNTRRWLADRTLNSFDPAQERADVSSIFKWYRQDFERAGGLKQFLARYAPSEAAHFLKGSDARITFKDYHWGLNDTSPLGAKYGGVSFWWDWMRNK